MRKKAQGGNKMSEQKLEGQNTEKKSAKEIAANVLHGTISVAKKVIVPVFTFMLGFAVAYAGCNRPEETQTEETMSESVN